MAAVGRYVLTMTGLAEVAFTIHDDLPCRGIGTWLLQRLIETARPRGIRGFVGYVLSSNVRMLNLFHRCGFPVESTLETGIYTVTIRFPEGSEKTAGLA
jgi:L-amino acid N-acyltransferase YncA